MISALTWGFAVLADEGAGAFLGEDLLAWLVLALGAALFVGNLAAVLKPPPRPREGDMERAPVGRSIAMALLGLVAAVWALASLAAG